MSSQAQQQDDFLGQPSYERKGGKTPKIVNGDNIYRILPPCGNLAKSGTWAVRHAIHWGWNGALNKWVTFRCIEKEDFQTKVILQNCPACDEFRKKQKAFENVKIKEEANGTRGKELKEFLAPHKVWLDGHNLEKKYYMNVLDQGGNITMLKIGYNHWKALRAEVAVLQARKPSIDPIGVSQGVYFNFHRGAEFTDTVRTVNETRVIEGNSYDAPKLAPLSKDIQLRMRNEAKLLDTLNRTLTYDEIKRIVDAKGDAQVVDSVLGAPEGQGAPRSSQNLFDSDEVDEAPSAQAVQEVASAVFPAVAGTPEEPSELEVMRAKLAAMEAAMAASKEVSKPASEAQPVQPQTQTGKLSDADFMAKFGPKKA